MLHSADFDAYSFDTLGRRTFRPYTNLSGFNKQMLLEVEEFEEVERRHAAGEKFNLDEETKARLVRAVRCMTNIYFIFAPSQMLIKIGQAKDVNKRLSSLRGSSPCELRLLATVRSYGDFEHFLHKKLATSRAHGEWFRPDERVLSAVEAAVDGGARQILGALQINVDAI
jgi:hypothetical protein